MKSLDIDRGCHLLAINDQHHDLQNFCNSLLSQIQFTLSQLHFVSRCPATYVRSLVLGSFSENEDQSVAAVT